MCAGRGIEEVCGIEEGTIFFFLFLLQNLKKIFTTSLMELFSVFFIKHLSTSDNYGGKIIMHANIMHAKIMHAKIMHAKIMHANIMHAKIMHAKIMHAKNYGCKTR